MTLRQEVAELRAEVAALRDVAYLFYEAGRSDALGIPPRVPPRRRRRDTHLAVVR